MPRRKTGKYADVLAHYGKAGFALPAKAPHVGSFPLYPKDRAQFALVIITAPRYDRLPFERNEIAEKALAAHPSLKSFWAARKRTIAARKKGRSSPMAATLSSKQIRIYAFDPEELRRSRVLLRRLLKSMGATDVRFGRIGLRTRDAADFGFEDDTNEMLVTIRGLGAGSRFSSSARREIRDFLERELDSLSFPASFINASPRSAARGSGETATAPYMRPRGKAPDGNRTPRAKAKGKARKQIEHRPNPKLLRYGPLPSRAAADAALRGHGFHDFSYDKRGVVPLLGPVYAYDAWAVSSAGAQGKFRVNVGRLRGTDQIEVRAKRLD